MTHWINIWKHTAISAEVDCHEKKAVYIITGGTDGMSLVLLVLFPQEICLGIFVISEGIKKTPRNKTMRTTTPLKLAS